ncbi:DUF5719 family protein [Frondihabitans cladoniiphilus]|uniref:Large extracellular alpha-helical protein n=1 Tax=Frondihabitans cladoniiphilus TaxID=715785 RepID=A0ABP8WDT5_9MICO
MTRRTIVRTGVRIAVGVVALAIGGGVVAAATVVPLPTLSQTPAGRVVTPVALDQQRACSGSLLRLAGDASASATSVTAQGAASTATAASGKATPTSTPLAGSDGAASKPEVVTAAAAGGVVPLVSGAQLQNVSAPDLSGIAASPCAEPTSSTWLVGGSTETGRTTLIDLVNPTDVNSTVDIALWGETGTVQGPGLTGIVVAPKSQKVIPLAGFATGLVSPVLHVTSRGGQITASLQESIVRTLQPGGVDVVSAAAAPSTTQSIPGIVVRDSDQVQTQLGESGYGDLKSILRAFNPGTTAADLSIQVSTPDGTGATFSVSAAAGQVTDVPLDGLPDGVYTATVQSTEPVVTGARSSSDPTSGTSDLAWVGSAPALDGATLFTVAPLDTAGDATATLTLANATDRPITAKIASPGVPASSVTVAANSSVSQSLVSGRSATLTGADGLRGAIAYSGSDGIAAYALVSPSSVSTPVTVYP